MRNAIDLFPVPGQVTNVQLLYDKGVYEIINDSPFRLVVNGIGGSVHIEAGCKVIFSNQRGGNSIQIQPLQTLLIDINNNVVTPASNPASRFPPIVAQSAIIVNEYFPEEIIATAYPLSLSRISINSISRPVSETAEFTGSSGPASVAIGAFGPGSASSTQIWVTGFDFTGGLGTTTTHHTLTLANIMPGDIGGPTSYTWDTATGANTKAELFVRFPTPFLNKNNSTSISLTADVLDSTVKYSMTLYGFLQ